MDTDKWRLVTLDFLRLVHDLVNKDQQLIQTYGEAFEVLRYLENAQVVELEPAEKHGVFKIRKRF